MFESRTLTLEENAKAKAIFAKIYGRKDYDKGYFDDKNRRLTGVQGEVWFNTELRKAFGRHCRWIAERKEVRGYVELPGDFFVDHFGTIEVKTARDKKECRVYCERWDDTPTMYLAVLFKDEDGIFHLLGFKYGHEVYESECDGVIQQFYSYYKVKEFRSPKVFIKKLKKALAFYKNMKEKKIEKH